MAKRHTNHLITFVDGTVVMGLINAGNVDAYRRYVASILKVYKVIIDSTPVHTPLCSCGNCAQFSSFLSVLGIQVADSFLNSKYHSTVALLFRFFIYLFIYRAAIESVLTSSCTAWFGSITEQDKTQLQRL